MRPVRQPAHSEALGGVRPVAGRVDEEDVLAVDHQPLDGAEGDGGDVAAGDAARLDPVALGDGRAGVGQAKRVPEGVVLAVDVQRAAEGALAVGPRVVHVDEVVAAPAIRQVVTVVAEGSVVDGNTFGSRITHALTFLANVAADVVANDFTWAVTDVPFASPVSVVLHLGGSGVAPNGTGDPWARMIFRMNHFGPSPVAFEVHEVSTILAMVAEAFRSGLVC